MLSVDGMSKEKDKIPTIGKFSEVLRKNFEEVKRKEEKAKVRWYIGKDSHEVGQVYKKLADKINRRIRKRIELCDLF
ncbi:MAG: hypothetical protein GH144_02020 [Clostridia bacterium]|nr:hypothetical protein [Clostridia bacterium]